MTESVLILLSPQTARARRARLAARKTTALRALGADATRLRILEVLRDGEACGSDLAWICQRSAKVVSHHLRRLAQAQLVSARRDGKMVLYQLTATAEALLAVGERP